MALITLANPEKNTFPVAASLILMSSLKLAPAQNVLSPPLFKTMTLMSSFCPASLIVLANFANISPGSELCAG